jgi:hypothetical protein
MTQQPTSQPVNIPPFDVGNPGVQQGIPATLTTHQPPEAPQILLATIRCGGTTLTVHLGRDDAVNWGRHLIHAAQNMTSLIVPAGALPPAALNGHDRAPS